MPPAQFDEFMKISKFFYKSVGISPYREEDDRNSRSFLLNAIFYIGMFNLNIIMLGEIMFVFLALRNGENFVEATAAASYIGYVSVGDFKMFYVWKQKQKLTDFIQYLRSIYPRTQEEQDTYQLKQYLKRATMIMTLYGILIMILIWTYNLFAIFQYLIFDRWLHIQLIEPTLPYFMYSPWNWKDNWSYYFLYFVQTIAGYTSAAGQISSDLLLCSTAIQVIMHYDHVARKIMQYKPVSKRADMNFLQEVIEYHHSVLKQSDNLNEVFGIPLLFNFMMSTFIICFVGFQMTIGASGSAMFKLFLFLFSALAQVYLICNYGQDLINSSENIENAIYNHTWYDADIHYKKMLVVIMQRAQKPSFLKATLLMKISLNSMTGIIQLSYKFFALLRTMYSE